ncbi:PREDICTED: ceramide kinase-like isoform X2 [Nelumbo nucifera]|uniref:DAGKc domain-containing protein n=2 Tax=Nelumbo nucifera TaxID=4432 RepID=A0A822XE19_NELNU|nr:PREDICTED: ceramide kinase-like isoform X2 [Nelumbo nucifera]DAD18427.1 TPA_asm: hypothetical protein HUJ06_019890 [Nelumbo nucifera]
MERIGDGSSADISHPSTTEFGGEVPSVSSNLFLDHVGEVVLNLNSDGLSWKPVGTTHNDMSECTCLGIKLTSKVETKIKFSNIYAVELINGGLVHKAVLPNSGGCLLGRGSKMYRFVVHGVQRSKTNCSLWVLATCTFGHTDLQTCQVWINRINDSINKEVGRPKNLLIFVNPLSGKGKGRRTWETVAPIFSRAKVKTKVTVTDRAGHAFDVMASITDEELNSYNGVVVVGGDGFFNEILNGLLSSRHKAPYPPAPTDFVHLAENNNNVYDANDTIPETPLQNERDPLLESSGPSRPGFSTCRTEACADQDSIFPFPNENFSLGIIPAGSTDAIVICTTGARDPVTSALDIVLGKRVCLDIAQVVIWRKTSSSRGAPSVRYAASFAGYGFFGDVIKESENYRWMGPIRYDFAGTKVFLEHRSYEAEIKFLEAKTENENQIHEKDIQRSWTRSLWNPPKKSRRLACCVNCSVCSGSIKSICTPSEGPIKTDDTSEALRWLQSKGRFLSVGAAVISCRNERAPDGLVADAHLADGFLHLVLIKECPRALYLWHLTQVARKGGEPLNFKFVEHHKTKAFMFTSIGDTSVWNLDGELFEAHQLSAQVFQGLISLFAVGPGV